MTRAVGLVALFLIGSVAAVGWAQPAPEDDAVEELRRVLRTPVRDPGNRDELLWREQQLKASARVLKVGDLRRALQLQEWRYLDTSPEIAAVDRPIRDSMINRLLAALRRMLQSPSVPTRLAAVTQIGEMGVTVIGPTGNTNLAATLTPELAKRTNDPNPAVRQAAARSLGRINPNPKVATAALGGLLDSADPADRRAAADALLLLLRTASQMIHVTGPNRLSITRGEAARIDQAVIPLAGRGAADASASVRQTAVEALQVGAGVLADLVTEVPRVDFPPPGRKPSKEELEDIEAYRKTVEDERDLLLPVVQALAAQGAVLRQRISDPVPQIRLLAERAVEEVGQTRLKILYKIASVPALETAPAPNKEKTQALPGADLTLVAAEESQNPLPRPKAIPRIEGVRDPLLDPLRLAMPLLAEQAVSDPVPEIRLAAVDALETLGPEAAPVVPALARALEDCSIFVRWAAARVLGKVGPVDTGLTVPILTKLLTDPDLDVERVAANTLAIYGPRAASAVPALAAAIHAGDPERRMDMIQTLVAIGPAGRPAIPDITSALANPDVRVRRAAAEALGHFGGAARSAIPALEKALNDADGDVRKAASDSLLDIEAGE